MSVTGRLVRLEQRVRAIAATGPACRVCRNLGPDLLLAWKAEKEGREPVKVCPACGREGRFHDLGEMTMKWEDIKALRRRRHCDADAEPDGRP